MSDTFGELRFSGIWSIGELSFDRSGGMVIGLLEGLDAAIWQADPRIRVSGDLVRRLAVGDARLAPGARLIVDGPGKRVVYVVGAYQADEDWYEAQWPD